MERYQIIEPCIRYEAVGGFDANLNYQCRVETFVGYRIKTISDEAHDSEWLNEYERDN